MHAKNFDNIISFLFVMPTTFETSTVYVNGTILAKSFLINGQTVAAEIASAMILTSIWETRLIT